jgi:regulator of nucleoside diphosphate kinase
VISIVTGTRGCFRGGSRPGTLACCPLELYMHPPPVSPAFGENLWLIVRPSSDTPGQWVARCLNLDIISISPSPEGALRAAAEAVADCLRGAAPLPRRRPARDEWSLVQLINREGSHGSPAPGVAASATAQLRLTTSPAPNLLAAPRAHVERLPPVWLDHDTIAAQQRAEAPPGFLSLMQSPFKRQLRRRSTRCGQASLQNTASGTNMPSLPDIIVTTQDFERLQHLVSCSDTSASERLDAELARAKLMVQTEVPADVVTMNSDVVYEDATSGERRAIRLVYPRDAEATRGFVSVLAPIGSALLGLRQGQEIEWPTPSGKRRLRVLEVPYQPERAGDFAL